VNTLRTFSIYENPTDYPGRFVVRGWTSTASSLAPDAARAAIPAELVCEPRAPGDDAVIVEVWL